MEWARLESIKKPPALRELLVGAKWLVVVLGLHSGPRLAILEETRHYGATEAALEWTDVYDIAVIVIHPLEDDFEPKLPVSEYCGRLKITHPPVRCLNVEGALMRRQTRVITKINSAAGYDLILLGHEQQAALTSPDGLRLVQGDADHVAHLGDRCAIG